MLTHCSVIREAYKATLADWENAGDESGPRSREFVQQTAALASVRVNDTVTVDQVRKVLGNCA